MHPATNSAGCLFLLILRLSAGLTQMQRTVCISFQFLLGIEQADRYVTDLCLLAITMNMHNICFFVDHKVANRLQVPTALS